MYMYIYIYKVYIDIMYIYNVYNVDNVYNDIYITGLKWIKMV